MRASTKMRGASLAEVMLAFLILALVALAVLSVLAQAARLEARDEESTTVSFLTQELLEERIDRAREPEGYAGLEVIPLAPTRLAGYLYEQDVVAVADGLQRITISTFYEDPSVPGTADSSRPHGGRALTLSVVVGEPTP